MTISFDDNGVKVDGVVETRQKMIDKAKIVLAPYLNGAQLRTDESSVLGRIISITAVPATETAQIVPVVFNSLDINSAEGLQVDYLANISNVKRISPSQAGGLAVLFGDLGTVISQGARVGNSITGDIFATDSQVTLNPVGANGIEISVNTIISPLSITYTIDGYLSQSPSIVVQLGSQDTTKDAVLNRIVDAVNTQSSYLQATKNNNETVKIVIVDQSKTGSFSVSSNLTMSGIYKPVYITSATYGASESNEGEITTRISSISGWRGVTNPFYIFPSAPIESDNDLKYRLSLKASGSVGHLNSLLFALKSIRGVTYEGVRTGKDGTYVSVLGGNEDDIAYAIFNSYLGGVDTLGNVTKTVTDINGGAHTVRFSRPTPMALQISMSLVVLPNFPIGGEQIIKQAIVEWFNNLNVGEDIYYSRLYEPILSVQGFSVRNLRIGIAGGSLGTDDIVIPSDRIATISAENISIGGR